MKHLKFLTVCFALLFSISIHAQNSATETPQEDEVMIKAQAFSESMISTLGITNESKIKTIEMLNYNFELTVFKTAQKDITQAEKEEVTVQVEESRNRRFQGLLTLEQYESYLEWNTAD